jgi:hypothetical protein
MALPTRPAGILALTQMDQAPQERARGQNDSAGAELPAVDKPYAPHRPRDVEIVRLPFDHMQIGRRLDRTLHGPRVQRPIRLRAWSAHRRALASVKDSELNAALIGNPAHQPIKRVDFADQMTLPESPNSRIAGHGADGRKSVGDQRSFSAHAGSCRCSFTARVPAADDNNVVLRPHSQVLIACACRAFLGKIDVGT